MKHRPGCAHGQGSPLDRYRLNVLVDNSGLHGAPVIVETNPTYGNLVGRVEYAQLGTLVTDCATSSPARSIAPTAAIYCWACARCTPAHGVGGAQAGAAQPSHPHRGHAPAGQRTGHHHPQP